MNAVGARWAPVAGPFDLTRDQLRRVAFVLAYPEPHGYGADATTLRRFAEATRALDANSFVVVFLYPARCPSLQLAAIAIDPIGPNSDDHIVRALAACTAIVAAWGHLGPLLDRTGPTAPARRIELLDLAAASNGLARYHLGLNAHGDPIHPLDLPPSDGITPVSCDALPRPGAIT